MSKVCNQSCTCDDGPMNGGYDDDRGPNSFRCHFSFMDGMHEFDEVLSLINMRVREGWTNVGPVPFEIHQSSTQTFYMADDSLTYGELEAAYKLWEESEEPDEWVEVVR